MNLINYKLTYFTASDSINIYVNVKLYKFILNLYFRNLKGHEIILG